MRIRYIACDSLGVKSMCTQVKTRDTVITIDPGVSIESASFPLPENKRKGLVRRYYKRVRRSCNKSEFIIITHYHHDHYIPDIDFYKDKRLIVKDYNRNINKSQRKRAYELMELIDGNVDSIAYADNNTFVIDKTAISISEPLWHGNEKTRLGFVVMVEIVDEHKNKRLLYTSDLNGIYIEKYADMIINIEPDILIMDGFPSYLLGYVVSYKNLKSALKNTIKILENTNCEKYIIDHHLLRDYRYREIYYEVYKRAEELGRNVLTAAEDMGKRPVVVEAYEKYGPTKWNKWSRVTFKTL